MGVSGCTFDVRIGAWFWGELYYVLSGIHNISNASAMYLLVNESHTNLAISTDQRTVSMRVGKIQPGQQRWISNLHITP